MSRADRHVEQLRLRARSDRDAQRTALAMEDALATASFAGERRDRLILVRQLRLGPLPAGLPPQSLALALERSFAQLTPVRVDARNSGAARAAAVCFESAVEAHIALALRLLEGPPPGEWFWPLAVPAWTPEVSRGEALRALALALADRPEAATAVRAWVGALARGGHGGALLAALTPEDRRHLIERVGGRPPIAPETGSQPRAFLAALGVGGGPAAAPGGEPSPRERPPGEAPQGGRAGARHPEAALSARGGRLRRADGAESDAERFAHPGDAEGLPHPAGTPAAPPAGQPSPGEGASSGLAGGAAAAGSDGAGGSRSPESHAESSPRAGPAELSGDLAEGPGLSPAVSEASGGGGGAPGQSLRRRGRSKPSADPAPDGGTRPARSDGSGWRGAEPSEGLSRAGGLLFLLNALGTVGFPAWLERQRGSVPRQQSFTLALLVRVLEELGVPPEDPLWRALAFDLPLPRGSGLPAGRLRRRGGVTLWRQRLRRHLRYRHRIGLEELVLRPGLVYSTATHLEVGFALTQVDLRIRCAGLDLDPGWLPWLGRVVTFRYGEERF